MHKAAAGILILAEGRRRNGRLKVAEGLSNEIDRIGGPVGHYHATRVNIVALGNQLFQRPRLRLRIVSDEFRTGSQMTEQRLMTAVRTDVRREVAPDAFVSVCVVAVSLNHD